MHRKPLLAAAACATAFLLPMQAMAATSGTGTATLPLLGGSLSVGGIQSSITLASTAVTAGTTSGVINSATWGDTTGSGAGWNGTIQLTTGFIYTGSWVQTGGTTTALGNVTAGGYTGSTGNALIVVTVTTSTGAVTQFSWTDSSGAGTNGTNTTCNNVSACTVSNGVTIAFAAATVYPAGAVYTVKAGELTPSGASLLTADASTVTPTGTTGGGTNLPTYKNNGSTVSAGGSAVKFLSAALNQGAGTFTAAPGMTITWDPNNTWAGSGVNYTATAQYAISTGP